MDVIEVINAAATKPYGFMPFYPGPGVGGHCIPCDPHYLLWQLRAARFDSPVARTAMTAIALRPRERGGAGPPDACRERLCHRGARVLVVGVAYKPGVADVRESPALEIIEGWPLRGLWSRTSTPGSITWTRHTGRLTSHPAPERDAWDLVLVHTRHPASSLTGSPSTWCSTRPRGHRPGQELAADAGADRGLDHLLPGV